MSAFTFATSRTGNNRYVGAGWTVSVVTHISALALLFVLARTGVIDRVSPPVLPHLAAVPQPKTKAEIERMHKTVSEIRMRRLQVAQIRNQLAAQLEQNNAPHTPTSQHGQIGQAKPAAAIPAAAAPDDANEAARLAREDLAESAKDYAAIRAAQMQMSGGVPVDEAKMLSQDDPLAQEARDAARSADLQRMLYASRALAGAAHHLPEGPTGIAMAVDQSSVLPGAQENQPGQAVDPSTGNETPPPGPDFANIQPIAGRRIGDAGTPSQWMYVDSWYCVGPFPNHNRENLHTVYPPENEVNLNAAYEGKNGRMVTWQFVQSPKPSVVPLDPEQYGIYYLYTELWVDHPQDLWIAVGSDDASKMWINGQNVWTSTDDQRSWRIDEGFRKVHFNQGINTVLARLENGWRGTAISLVVRVSPG